MNPSDRMAPWQIAPVPLSSRIASAGLAVLSLDSLFNWRATPNATIAAALAIIPALIAIRLIRGLPRAVGLTVATFAGVEAVAILALVLPGPFRSAQMTAGLAVAAVVAAGGLASVLVGRLHGRRAPVIELTRTAETQIAIRARNA